MNSKNYPQRIYCNFQSSANGDIYGGYSNKPLSGKGFDNVEYVRADSVGNEE